MPRSLSFRSVHRRAFLPLCLPLLAPLVACETSGSAASPAGVRDTLPNGAERVRYGALPVAEPEPASADLRIGVLEGDPEYIFGDVRGIEVGDDGVIYVLDAQASEIRAFEPDGAFRDRIARQGEGPGEIAGANGLVRALDGTLWVQDHDQWQIIRFSPDGEEVERIPMFVRQYGYLWDGAVDAAGRIWTEVSHSDEPYVRPQESGVVEGTSRRYLKAHDPRSGDEDSVFVGSHTGRSHATIYDNGGGSFRQIPFDPRLVHAADLAGGVWTATTDAYRVSRLNAQGDTALVIEVDVTPEPVTDDDRRRLVEQAAEADDDGTAERAARAMVEHMRDVKPVLSQLVVDDEGRLWVRRFEERDAERSLYDAFDRDGNYHGSVLLGFRTSRYFAPRIRNGRLYTVAIDDFDVPSVVRAEISLTEVHTEG